MTTPEYLDPVRDELDRLRTERAALASLSGEWRARYIEKRTDAEAWEAAFDGAQEQIEALTQELATVRDNLRHRSNALNATGTHNDQLRAQLARVKKVQEAFVALERIVRPLDDTGATLLASAASDLRRALADKEPTP